MHEHTNHPASIHIVFWGKTCIFEAITKIGIHPNFNLELNMPAEQFMID